MKDKKLKKMIWFPVKYNLINLINLNIIQL